jgi:hypothetical protein
MHQNGIAFHAAHGMLNKETDLTQGFMDSLLLSAQGRAGVLFALARLLGREVKPITPVVRLKAERASIDSDIDIYKPVQLRRKLLFQHEVSVMVTAKRPPQQDDKRVRERHDGILPRLLVFSHWNAHVVWHHLLTDARLVQWPQ